MIVDVIFIVAAIAILIAIYKLKFSKQNINHQIQQATHQAGNVEAPKTDVSQTQATSSWANSNQEEEESEEQEQQNEGPVDRKKQLRKEQKQKEKQQKKEAHQWFLKEEQQKRQKADKLAEQREREEQQLKRKEEEVIAQLRQDERKRKEEEFNKWKDMFKVEQSGQEKLSEEEEKRKTEAFNTKLITLLRKHKLVLLEDLSHEFKLSTKEIVQKIKKLEGEGQISGIFDERGKYLVIEDNEWQAIKSYISARGRVKKTDIMNECAKLIKIPEQVEEGLLDLLKEVEAQ